MSGRFVLKRRTRNSFLALFNGRWWFASRDLAEEFPATEEQPPIPEDWLRQCVRQRIRPEPPDRPKRKKKGTRRRR
jgi:hypothetical protein